MPRSEKTRPKQRLQTSIESDEQLSDVDLVDDAEAAWIVDTPVNDLEKSMGAPLFVDSEGRRWWGRMACETVGLSHRRRGDPANYWLSMAQAAELLGIARQNAYKVPMPIRWAGGRSRHKHRAVRRIDVVQIVRARDFHSAMRA